MTLYEYYKSIDHCTYYHCWIYLNWNGYISIIDCKGGF